MPRAKKLNLGERVKGTGKGGKGVPKNRIKSLVEKKVDNVEEEEPTTFVGEIEVKEDIDKDSLIKMMEDLLNKKEAEKQKLSEEKKKAKEVEKEKKKKEREERLKQKQEAEQKKLEEQQKLYLNFIEDTIYKRDKSAIVKKISDLNSSRTGRLVGSTLSY